MQTAKHEPGEPRFRVPRNARTGIIATVSTVICATSLFAIPAASAAVPNFPDNLVVFPDRDFVTIEGYQDHIGETATVEVRRSGAGVIGSAKGVVQAGDVAFEINHPGGYCWGAGTGLNVTPDIRPGDTVSIKFGATDGGETKVQDLYVTGDSVRNGNTLTVKGHIGSGVNRAQLEQRIIEPALKDTAVGRRDVRALPGPLTPAPRGGYQSSLEFDTDGSETFTATYVFDNAAAAEIADSAGGERAMSWEAEDSDANRQGLTIAEFGEAGGPGMGGCPNGPLQSGPAGPTDVLAAKVPGGLKLTWTPAKAVPGTPAITGYRATAVAQTVHSNEQMEIGKRITGQSAAGTTITGLDANESYDVYVVAESSTGPTFPAIHAIPQTDMTPPTVTASSNGGTFSKAQKVTLTANEAGSDIYYTTDGTDPFIAGGTTDAATRYTAPLDVATTTTLTFAAIDPSGNVSESTTATFTITDDPVPSAPAFSGVPTAGLATASLSWTAPDPGSPELSITGYTVQAYSADGAAFGAPKTVAGDVTNLSYDGLTVDGAYYFTVNATNKYGTGLDSAKSETVTIQGAVVANAGTDQTVARRTTATTVTLDGSKSTVAGATYTWEQVLAGPTDPDKVTLTGGTTLTPTFVLPLYNYPMTNKPLMFRLTVTAGTTVRSDEVKVSPAPDKVTIALAQWKTGDLRVEGTGTVVGSIVSVRAGGPGGRVLGQVAVTAAAPPAIGGVWSLRLRNAAAGTSNPGTLWIESTVGGAAGPTLTVNK
ncbi:fibronectin type III domain-containing protein [Pseudarthrobacter sp. MM222]|uniref:fibronectin type III domain-containing protein n=1 Tax=Pseudarthrobacter sp. MM222 TaxID=3018929 RepID=UPI00221F21ED|nr:chitobiase/beta-hexosaminidase C-terminal domain-containing protein [Pseudarthrobacter sp. MM222]CAI3798043.1 hypothetical protein NKCBBBOE_01977 [Pseudarthrobacter sp. MM222]